MAHLTDDLVQRYRQHTLSPAELLDLDAHIAACDLCRSRLANPVLWQAAHTKLVDAELSTHLSQETLVDYLIGDLGAREQEASRRHLETCRECDRELARLAAFQQGEVAAVRAETSPTVRANRGLQGIALPRLSTLYCRPGIWLPLQTVVVAGATVFTVVHWQVQPLRENLRSTQARVDALAQERSRLVADNQQIQTEANRLREQLPVLERQNGALKAREAALASDVTKQRERIRVLEAQSPKAEPTSGLRVALNDGGGEIVKLPDGSLAHIHREVLPRMAAAALGSGLLKGPPELQQLGGEAPAGKGGAARFQLQSPVGTVVLEQRPTFRWASVRGAVGYRLSLLDETERTAARASGMIREARWVSPDPLIRGHRYRWEVQALDSRGQVVGQAPQRPDSAARFQVLADNKLNGLREVLEKYSTSHLLKALHYVHAGLLDDADREIEALAKLNPKSSIPRRLHAQIRALRSAGRGLK